LLDEDDGVLFEAAGDRQPLRQGNAEHDAFDLGDPPAIRVAPFAVEERQPTLLQQPDQRAVARRVSVRRQHAAAGIESRDDGGSARAVAVQQRVDARRRHAHVKRPLLLPVEYDEVGRRVSSQQFRRDRHEAPRITLCRIV
jgi:hypothetical protein